MTMTLGVVQLLTMVTVGRGPSEVCMVTDKASLKQKKSLGCEGCGDSGVDNGKRGASEGNGDPGVRMLVETVTYGGSDSSDHVYVS